MKRTNQAKRTQERWLEFSLVGLMGAAVQLGILHALTAHGGIRPLVAIAIAIELTLVHNFLWHERLTWRDRPSSGWRQRMRQVVAFHLANGGVSLVGNLGMTEVLLRYEGLHVITANLVAVCLCSVGNFFLGDRWVFQNDAVADQLPETIMNHCRPNAGG